MSSTPENPLAWFLTPLRPGLPAHEPGRAVHWRETPTGWDLAIHAATPRHGSWTVLVHGVKPGTVDLTREQVILDESGFSSGAGFTDHLAPPVPSDEVAQALSHAQILIYGLDVNHMGTVTATDPDGIALVALTTRYDGSTRLALRAAAVGYEPVSGDTA